MILHIRGHCPNLQSRQDVKYCQDGVFAQISRSRKRTRKKSLRPHAGVNTHASKNKQILLPNSFAVMQSPNQNSHAIRIHMPSCRAFLPKSCEPFHSLRSLASPFLSGAHQFLVAQKRGHCISARHDASSAVRNCRPQTCWMLPTIQCVQLHWSASYRQIITRMGLCGGTRQTPRFAIRLRTRTVLHQCHRKSSRQIVPRLALDQLSFVHRVSSQDEYQNVKHSPRHAISRNGLGFRA